MAPSPSNAGLASPADLFEAERPRLRRIAFRMLGSLADADDVVQEAWLRLSCAEAASGGGLGEAMADLPAWLTSVTARLALDALGTRRRRGEEPLGLDGADEATPQGLLFGVAGSAGAEEEAILADEVGLALLLILGRLKPAERLAFVLHDAFGLSFDEVAVILDRTPEAARQMASRARRKVRGEPIAPAARADRAVVAAFAQAAREDDVAALVRLLDPEVTLRIDPARLPPGAPAEVRGARVVAGRATMGALGRSGQLVLVDGRPALAVAPRGRLDLVLTFQVVEGRIAGIEVVAEPSRLVALDLALVPEP